MNRHNEITPAPEVLKGRALSPRDPHATIPRRLFGALLLCLTFSASPAAAQPTLEGNYEDIVVVRPDDCPACTPSQRNLLENGVKLLRTRLARETLSVDAEVCVTSASLARDMAVLTFEAYRSGDISLSRWREHLKAQAKIAGGISGTTQSLLLGRFRDDAIAELGALTHPSHPELIPRLLKIFGAAQYSRLFEELSRENWNVQSWQDTLLAAPVGFNFVVNALLSTAGPSRHVLDRLALSGGFQHIWQEGQLWHLTALPGDFEVGSIPQARENLRQVYVAAVTDHLATVMANGCASEAAAALRREAFRLAQGLRVRPGMDKQQAVEGENHPDGVIDIIFGSEITVDGEPVGIEPVDPGGSGQGEANPGCACGGFPGAQGGQGGTAGNLGGGGSSTNTTEECSLLVEVQVLRSIQRGENCQPIPPNCHLSAQALEAAIQALGTFPTACEPKNPNPGSEPESEPEPPGPPELGPRDVKFDSGIRARCIFECDHRGGKYAGFFIGMLPGTSGFALAVTCNCR